MNCERALTWYTKWPNARYGATTIFSLSHRFNKQRQVFEPQGMGQMVLEFLAYRGG